MTFPSAKPMRNVGAATLLTLLAANSALTATSATVAVPGSADPYLAGMPNGTACCGGDSAPAQSPVQIPGSLVTPGAVLTFSVTGSISNSGGTPTDPPDGGGFFGSGAGANNGIASANIPINALVGVFLDDTLPTASAAPAGLDFSLTGALTFTSFAPALKQVFFIGDGLTGNRTGAQQQFIVPAGATRLFLGGFDAFGWYNNSGSFTVTVTSTLATSVLPQFAFGGGWYSALYFSNTGTAAVSFPVNFTSDTSAPLVIPAIGSSATVSLAPQATAILEAPNVGGLSQGYVAVSMPGGVIAYGVFRQSVPGVPDQEAVVPLSSASATNSTLTWDDTTYTTGVAIVNPSAVPVNVAIAVWDSFGNVIGTSSISLASRTKTEATLRSLPGLGAMLGRRGSAKFSVSSGAVAVLGLRFNGAAFTSIPTVSQ